MRRLPAIACLLFATFMIHPEFASGKQIGDMNSSVTDISEQTKRFFSFKDPSVRYVLIGAILLGISCGLMGGFIVV